MLLIACRSLLVFGGVSLAGLGSLLGFWGVGLWQNRAFHLEAAELLVDSGRHDQAQAMLEARLRQAPWDSSAHMLLGRSLAGMGKMRSSAQALARVPQNAPNKADALLREGQAYLQILDAVEAERAFRASVDHPNAKTAVKLIALNELCNLFAAEDRQEDLNQALWLQHSLADPSSKPTVLLQLLSRRLLRVSPMVRAERLQQFLAGNPDDLKAKIALGRCYVEDNQLEEGRRILEQCLDAHPESIDVWRGLLWCLFQQGDLARLGELLPDAPKVLDEESGMWKMRAIVAENSQNWEESERALNNAITLSPHEMDLHSQYAVVLARLGKRDRAKEHSGIAESLRAAQGDLTTAYEDWNAATSSKSSPDMLSEIVGRLADACVRAGMSDEAESWKRIQKTIDMGGKKSK